jgi:hypothetical protein
MTCRHVLTGGDGGSWGLREAELIIDWPIETLQAGLVFHCIS